MFILLCGKPGTGTRAVCSRLVHYFSYRSTACYEYDYLSPLRDIEDASGIVLSRYLGIEEIENLTEESLAAHLYTWGSSLLAPVAKKQVDLVTARWDELKLHYIVVIHGISPSVCTDFDPAFKVQLRCDETVRKARILAEGANPRRESRLDLSFDDYAVCDIFDLVVDTGVVSPDEAATLIGESLHDKMLSPFKGTKDKDTFKHPTDNGSST